MTSPDQFPERTLERGPSSAAPPEGFTDSFILFRETTRRFQERYEQLETQFESLQVKLEETNIELRQSLEDKDRVSNYLNNILESLTGGVLVIDPDGDITLFNQAAREITGRTQEEVLGRPYAEVIGIDAGRENSALYTLDTGNGLSNREKVLKRPDGRSIFLGFSTSLVRDEAGRVLGAVEVFNDLTEVKRLEAEVQRAHTLAALGEMAATVAHEVRNPLGGIATFANLLGRELEPQDTRYRLVNKIAEGVARLNRIVTNLLNYTRPLHLSTHRVDLVDLVEETTSFFAVELERTCRPIILKRVYPQEKLYCRVDPEQFQQVILNLLKNATQAMPEGGTLTVQVRADSADASSAMVSICDTGIGMTSEIQEKLFLPFFTTKEDGTGLGLVTSKKIVEAHNGQIRVASRPDTGTCFTIILPQ